MGFLTRSRRPDRCDRGSIQTDEIDVGVRMRYCALLQRETFTDEECTDALRALESQMANVPAGTSSVINHSASYYGHAERDLLESETYHFEVDSIYIDRYAVRNEEYQAFVEIGGYESRDFWPDEILANVVQFVDLTGCPGPKFWSDGRPPKGREKHPVVGLCWYEANAFATWLGKRLPTSAEWQRAGTWIGETTERRYPWGNSFDGSKVNTWSSGIGDTVAVDAFAQGSTPNGVYQLAGNVWEWVGTLFECPGGQEGTRIIMEQPMAEVRGGAFDTYFASQATCLFRTGQPMLSRRDNVGFRCCVSMDALNLPADPFAFLDETYE